MKEAMTMSMEWLANPHGLYGACFTLQDQHFGLVLGLGVRWDTTVLSIVKTVSKLPEDGGGQPEGTVV